MQRILHGIFTTRMLLNLREAAVPPLGHTDSIGDSDELWDTRRTLSTDLENQ